MVARGCLQTGRGGEEQARGDQRASGVTLHYAVLWLASAMRPRYRDLSLHVPCWRASLLCVPQAEPEPGPDEVVDEGGMEGAEDDVITDSTAGGAGPSGRDDEEEGEEAEFEFETHTAEHGLLRALSSAGASTSGRGGGGGGGRAGVGRKGGTGGGALPQAQAVDPMAWRAEAERVAPQLGQIRIAKGDAYADWSHRWVRWQRARGVFVVWRRRRVCHVFCRGAALCRRAGARCVSCGRLLLHSFTCHVYIVRLAVV